MEQNIKNTLGSERLQRLQAQALEQGVNFNKALAAAVKWGLAAHKNEAAQTALAVNHLLSRCGSQPGVEDVERLKNALNPEPKAKK